MATKTVYVATAPVYLTNARGAVKVLPQGTEIKAAEYKALNAARQAKFRAEERAVVRKNVRWSSAELDLLIDLYLTHVDPVNAPDERGVIIQEFARVFPSRSGSAITLGIAQIKALDTYHPAQGMTDTSMALVNKLHAADPVRFPGGADSETKLSAALDRLLAQVRA